MAVEINNRLAQIQNAKFKSQNDNLKSKILNFALSF